MVCKASASIWRRVGPDGSLVKSCRHGGEGTGASSGQRPKLEVARSTGVARLTIPVVVMREDGEDEGGGARKAVL